VPTAFSWATSGPMPAPKTEVQRGFGPSRTRRAAASGIIPTCSPLTPHNAMRFRNTTQKRRTRHNPNMLAKHLSTVVAFFGDYGRVSLRRSTIAPSVVQGTAFAELQHKLSD
jgi:hypothetical protein